MLRSAFFLDMNGNKAQKSQSDTWAMKEWSRIREIILSLIALPISRSTQDLKDHLEL